MMPDSAYLATKIPDLRIQKNDRLSIVVTAKNPELAAPFYQSTGAYQVNEKGDVAMSSDQRLGDKGFLVDQSGHIEFPILGTMAVEGMTLEELKEYLRGQLERQKLIVNPIVKVELLNLKVNVMGSVNRVGVIDVPDAKMNLLEAISKAGGLSANAAPDKVTVIREQGGERKMIVHNIQSTDIFYSPGYYLQQNDIVYVAPKRGDVTTREQNNRIFISTGVSLLTLVFTFLNWMK